MTLRPFAWALATIRESWGMARGRRGFAHSGECAFRCSGSQVWMETQSTPSSRRARNEAAPASPSSSSSHQFTPRQKAGARPAAEPPGGGGAASPSRPALLRAAQSAAALSGSSPGARARRAGIAEAFPKVPRAWAAAKRTRGSEWPSAEERTRAASARPAGGTVARSHAPRRGSSPVPRSSSRAAATKAGRSR